MSIEVNSRNLDSSQANKIQDALDTYFEFLAKTGEVQEEKDVPLFARRINIASLREEFKNLPKKDESGQIRLIALSRLSSEELDTLVASVRLIQSKKQAFLPGVHHMLTEVQLLNTLKEMGALDPQ